MTRIDDSRLRPDPEAEAAPGRQRLDKWLWHARFCKTRSLAAKLCESGRLRIDSLPVTKAHHGVRPGDVLTFPLGPHIRVIAIVALGERRGPPAEAQRLYRDLAPPSRESALPRKPPP
ncbi:MAG: RNA-binding S4 domain-containing protein [Azospirillaceae bacterium]|nr:RNA-binding S4 domain-containing protein [Azospirillaceae bacterium]